MQHFYNVHVHSAVAFCEFPSSFILRSLPIRTKYSCSTVLVYSIPLFSSAVKTTLSQGIGLLSRAEKIID